MKYITNTACIALGFLAGCYASYMFLGQHIKDVYSSAAKDALVSSYVYDTPALIHLARKVLAGDIDEFNRLMCARLSSELKTFEKEFSQEIEERAAAMETMNTVKEYLAEMKQSSKCEDF